MLQTILQFDGQNDFVEIPGKSIPSGSEITVSFWSFGGNLLPKASSVIAVKGANNERVFSAHLPWDNSRIYFDSGNQENNYDRIEKDAQPSEFKEKWSHWAFTKNVTTGEMKIYLNGQLWHSGTGKTMPLIPATRVTLGCFTNSQFYHHGMISELQIWNKARSQDEIKANMSRRLEGKELGLVGYWPLNEGSGNIAHDKTSNANHGTLQGNPAWVQSEIPLESSTMNLPARPNILILLNDQDSAAVTERWPQTFVDQNLPALKRLKKNGITFKKAFTASAACSPSRATMLTSTYPTENGVLHTMAVPVSSDSRVAGDQPIGFTQEALRPNQVNLAHILQAAGYTVAWKGKWHLTHPVNGTDEWTNEDIQRMKDAFGFDEWNPGDAGVARGDFRKFGKGTYKNDLRYIEGNDYPEIKEIEDKLIKAGIIKVPFLKSRGARQFIRDYDPKNGPFCLIVSLVNPHDIHVAPHFEERAGYIEEEFANFNLPIPANVDEDLSTKPEIQEIWREASRVRDRERGGRIQDDADRKLEAGKISEEQYNKLVEKSQREIFPSDKSNPENIKKSRQLFVNFYGYLKKVVDEQMNSLLEELDKKGLTENTLIVRTADHGEMCLSHGQREKAFNAYDETIHIPLIFSNPRLFPTAVETNAFASSIDLVPTLAKVAGVYDIFKFAFRGSDLTPLFTNPQEKIYASYKDKDGKPVVRDCIHFTYDDGFLPDRFQYTPLYIRTIRTDDWKYSVYFNSLGNKFEYELYDLKKDPLENNNLVGVARYWDQQKILHAKLEQMMIKMGTVPNPYWIYTEEMMAVPFLPPLYWPTSPEAVLSSRMQYEGNKAEQKFRRSALIQKVGQVPVEMWWIG